MSSNDLRALLALQDLDTRIDHEEHRRSSLPERADLAQLERAKGQLATARRVVAQALAEVQSRQEQAEKELKASEDRLGQVNARLYGGSVSASRELQAMAADVDSLKKRISDFEDRALALMDEREPLDGQVAEMDRQLELLDERHADLSTRLSEAESEVVSVLAELNARRSALAAEVPSNLLPTYDRLRARLSGVAVARLTGGRCDGCHLALPAMELDRIRHHDAGALEYCEQCGRILVVPGD